MVCWFCMFSWRNRVSFEPVRGPVDTAHLTRVKRVMTRVKWVSWFRARVKWVSWFRARVKWVSWFSWFRARFNWSNKF